MNEVGDKKKRLSVRECTRAGARGPAPARLLCVVVMSVAAGCATRTAPPVGSPASSIEESVLYGGALCRDDSDCPGGVCAGTECVGFLAIPSDIARDQAGERLKAVVAGKDPVARRLAIAAAGVVVDATVETFGRARAADIFRFLPCELAGDSLLPAIGSVPEAVRFYVSRSLALCGNEAGVRGLEAFMEHPSEPVREMSRSALESLKRK